MLSTATCHISKLLIITALAPLTPVINMSAHAKDRFSTEVYSLLKTLFPILMCLKFTGGWEPHCPLSPPKCKSVHQIQEDAQTWPLNRNATTPRSQHHSAFQASWLLSAFHLRVGKNNVFLRMFVSDTKTYKSTTSKT